MNNCYSNAFLVFARSYHCLLSRMNCAHISPAVATAAIRDGSSLHFVRRGSHYFWIFLWRYCGPGKKSLDCRIRNHVRCPPGVRPIPVYISIMVFATGPVHRSGFLVGHRR